MSSSFGTTQEEHEAYCIFCNLVQDIENPKVLHLSYDEELSSFIMWYALLRGLKIKFIKGNSCVN